MKKLYCLFCLLILSFNHLYSQDIIFKIKDVKVDNVSIPNNAPIEFNGASSVTVQYKVQFTKPNYLFIGNVNYVNGTYAFGNFDPLIATEEFALVENNTGFTATYEKVLYANDYSYNGGNYLVAFVNQIQGTGGYPPLEWESNHIQIIRTPAFELSPSSLSFSLWRYEFKNIYCNKQFQLKWRNLSMEH